MTSTPTSEDPIAIVERLDPDAINERLDQLVREREALIVLLRAARARRGSRRPKPEEVSTDDR
jgi:hypothetical protein